MVFLRFARYTLKRRTPTRATIKKQELSKNSSDATDLTTHPPACDGTDATHGQACCAHDKIALSSEKGRLLLKRIYPILDRVTGRDRALSRRRWILERHFVLEKLADAIVALRQSGAKASLAFIPNSSHLGASNDESSEESGCFQKLCALENNNRSKDDPKSQQQ